MTTTDDNGDTSAAPPIPPSAIKDLGAVKKDLSPPEVVWANLRPWLEEHGYRLRPRYQPGWKASWLAEGFSGSRRDCEDYHRYMYPWIMDAVRIRDSALVVLKRVKKTDKDSDEFQFAELLSQEAFALNSRNHCVNIYEILDIPDTEDEALIVMPLLYTFQMQPEFDTVGEVVDFFRQALEGLQFLHRHNIAHRDCKWDNILADSGCLYNENPHPLLPGVSYQGNIPLKRRYSRTTKAIRYHYIDFGLSKRYSSRTGNFEPSPWGAGLYNVPEFQVALDTPTDPFPVDIYMLGMMFRQHFLDQTEIYSPRVNLEWMNDLARDMTLDDPNARPTIEEVLRRFNTLVKKLGFWKLRSPVNRAEYPLSAGYTTGHWIVQVSRMLRFIPATPTPPHQRSEGHK